MKWWIHVLVVFLLLTSAQSVLAAQELDLEATVSSASQDGLVPKACSGAGGGDACPQGDGEYRPDGYGPCEFVGLVNNVISFLFTTVSLIAVIVFVYAGFLLVSSQGDTGTIQKAKGMITNVVIGFVIMLSAFLVVNTIMAIMVGDDSAIMNWKTVSCTYSYKAGVADNSAIGLNSHTYQGIVTVMSSNNDYYPDAIIRGTAGGATYVQGDCSPSNLMSLGMNQTQANTFSCIARPESGCNLNADNPQSTARGVFQILRGFNDTGHNLNFPECTTAAVSAGYPLSGNLNCAQAFAGGQRKPEPNPLADACDAAASNLACNVKAALWLYKNGGAYNPWLGNKNELHHLAQRACVGKYDPSRIDLSKFSY